MSFGANNDSFGCIGNDDSEMEIDNTSNSNSNKNNNSLSLYQTNLVNKKIEDALSSMSQTITSKKHLISYQMLLSIPKNTFSLDEYNEIKSSIIIQKMTQPLKSLILINKRKQINLSHERFLIWKRKAKLSSYINQSKANIEAQSFARFTNKKKEIESLKNNKQKEINKIKEKINVLNEAITKLNKDIKSNEEKETSFNRTIKDLQENNTNLEENMRKSSKSTESSGLNSTKGKLTSKINELEISIKNLDEEMKEKDNNIIGYVKEMNEMLDVFEQKANQFNIHNNDEVCDRHKWKSPSNLRTTSLKNSFNILPNNNSISNNGNHISTPSNTNSSNNNHIQQKYSYNQSQTKQALKIHNTISSKTNQRSNPTNNTSNTSRGLFINITGNNNINHKK